MGGLDFIIKIRGRGTFRWIQGADRNSEEASQLGQLGLAGEVRGMRGSVPSRNSDLGWEQHVQTSLSGGQILLTHHQTEQTAGCD